MLQLLALFIFILHNHHHFTICKCAPLGHLYNGKVLSASECDVMKKCVEMLGSHNCHDPHYYNLKLNNDNGFFHLRLFLQLDNKIIGLVMKDKKKHLFSGIKVARAIRQCSCYDKRLTMVSMTKG